MNKIKIILMYFLALTSLGCAKDNLFPNSVSKIIIEIHGEEQEVSIKQEIVEILSALNSSVESQEHDCKSIGKIDIDGTEVRLLPSHDGVYAEFRYNKKLYKVNKDRLFKSQSIKHLKEIFIKGYDEE